MAKELTVEQTELLGRAAELEVPFQTQPSTALQRPSALSTADRAAKQLVMSSDNMRTYLASGEKEQRKMAASLRNAARAYGEIDEGAASAMDGGGSVSGGGVGPSDNSQTALGDTGQAQNYDSSWAGVKQAAKDIANGDQGSSFLSFANEWRNYSQFLQTLQNRFRPFQNWSGEAATSVEASMEQQRTWSNHMAELSTAMAGQAEGITTLQKWAYTNHPTEAYVSQLEHLYQTQPALRPSIMEEWKKCQAKSEEILTKYSKEGNLPPINPPKPPGSIDVGKPGPKGLIPDGLMPGGDGKGGMGQGMPQTPMMPQSGAGGMPDMASLTSKLGGAGDMPSLPEPGMSPMSVGGGGGGGGIPAAPLMPAAGAGGGAPIGLAPAAAGAGAIPGAAGGMPGGAAGGMGGGMPMGGMGGAGAGQGKQGKEGGYGDDEALYTEERSWTEAVIGNRRRSKDASS